MDGGQPFLFYFFACFWGTSCLTEIHPGFGLSRWRPFERWPAKLPYVEYRTVFDASQNAFSLAWPLIIALFASVFPLIGWAMRKSNKSVTRFKGVAFQCFGALGVIVGILCLVSNYVSINNYTKALSNRDYSVAEGVVSDFVPMPPGGHAEESFKINQKRFSYGSGWGSLVFNSEWNAGLLRNGVRARITYRGEDILKVEVQ